MLFKCSEKILHLQLIVCTKQSTVDWRGGGLKAGVSHNQNVGKLCIHFYYFPVQTWSLLFQWKNKGVMQCFLFRCSSSTVQSWTRPSCSLTDSVCPTNVPWRTWSPTTSNGSSRTTVRKWLWHSCCFSQLYLDRDQEGRLLLHTKP